MPAEGFTEEGVFTTPAFWSRSLKSPGGKGGFLCLWPDRLTFVGSRYVRFVAPFVGTLLIGPFRPTGPDDPRTLTTVRYDEIVTVASGSVGSAAKKRMTDVLLGTKVVVTTTDGRSIWFTGGQVNPALTADTFLPLVHEAMNRSGITTTFVDGVVAPEPAHT